MAKLRIGVKKRAGGPEEERREEVERRKRKKVPVQVKILVVFSVLCLVASAFLIFYEEKKMKIKEKALEEESNLKNLKYVLFSLSQILSACSASGLSTSERISLLSSAIALGEKALNLSLSLGSSHITSIIQKALGQMKEAKKMISLGEKEKALSLINGAGEEITYLEEQLGG